jgi:hypothetical protein
MAAGNPVIAANPRPVGDDGVRAILQAAF